MPGTRAAPPEEKTIPALMPMVSDFWEDPWLSLGLLLLHTSHSSGGYISHTDVTDIIHSVPVPTGGLPVGLLKLALGVKSSHNDLYIPKDKRWKMWSVPHTHHLLCHPFLAHGSLLFSSFNMASLPPPPPLPPSSPLSSSSSSASHSPSPSSFSYSSSSF